MCGKTSQNGGGGLFRRPFPPNLSKIRHIARTGPGNRKPFMRQSDNSEAVLLLRPLAARDVTFLTALWVASWRETMPTIDFAGRAAWLDGFLRVPEHMTLVAEATADGPEDIVGFATWEKDAGATTYLHQLVVAPRAKGTGVAEQLLDAVKTRAPSGLTLDVNQANARAVRFYEREGWTIIGAGTNPTSGLASWSLRWMP